MKKFAYLAAVALGLTFTACDDNDIIGIAVNPEEPVFETSDLVVTENAGAKGTLDLAALNYDQQNITVADIEVKDFPSEYELDFVMQIAADQSFGKVFDLPVSVVGNTVQINPDDLQGVYYSNISKGPKERVVYGRLAAYAVKDNVRVRIGNPDLYYGPYALSVLPYPSSLVIEENYYLLGTVNGWSVADALKFNHSDLNQYDDPVFTIKVDISPDQAKSGWWWKIVPQSTYATGNWVDGDNTSYGVAENGSEEMAGMLVGRTAAEDCGAGCIKEAGQFLLTINLEEGTYEFTNAVDFLYTPGDANGWSQTSSQLLYTEDYANYKGFAVLSPNGFKFTNAPDWSHINYGAGDAEGTLSTDGGAGNLTVPAKGLYWCNVNTASLTYSVAAVNTIGIIGDATPKGWDGSTALTPSADFLKWTGTVTLKGGEFKFRCNDAWDINLGGSMSDLQPGGANIASPGAGNYEITLDLSKLPYTCTVTAK